ncbi:hypothetical protein [Deinococcus roseus]|uniref:CopG family transcriptional regulator n=1 Tax=Deinococcus roseus TaxID=392414 RepID=A0ABQ2DEY3_9DEIO|nr:hypothetical protein [Deinococcus roseus]GGJ55601.1 hypothetical protein GCM10008938_47230 [Deinococcus roseus]
MTTQFSEVVEKQAIEQQGDRYVIQTEISEDHAEIIRQQAQQQGVSETEVLLRSLELADYIWQSIMNGGTVKITHQGSEEFEVVKLPQKQ